MRTGEDVRVGAAAATVQLLRKESELGMNMCKCEEKATKSEREEEYISGII